MLLNLLSSGASSGLTYEALLVLALVLLLGLYTGRWFEKIKLPHITGYIIMGVIIGGVLVAFGFGETVESLEVVSSVALGFIAFGIGTELEFDKLKKSGKEVVVITIIQAILAAGVTILGLLSLNLIWPGLVSLPIALVLGAIATATAPAPIMLLTRKYKAKGPLTDILLPLVGMDDAVGIILFGVLLSVANSLNTGADLSVVKMLEGPMLELLFSAVIGALVGFIAAKLIKKIRSRDSQKEEVFLSISVFAVFITVAFAKMHLAIGDFPIHLSPILTPMIMGVVLTNSLSRVRAHDVNLSVESFSAPILIAFFTLAGSELVVAFAHNTDVPYGMLFGITAAYIVLRSIGKVYGAHLGGKLMNSHRSVKKYLGICLLPQAGVALGMAYQAKNDFGEPGTYILIIVLIATLVYEMFGPIGVKLALHEANEIILDK
ncbi:Sodium/hydrogen exchanger family protein [Candidatus Izimaplasma bacterium HR1]|uniref:cation:proton antiporter n=1 Tax=Candidatus Izimoplasma sp. HR1 TaxID=1541959 RepID=UPI0004F67AE7|nr:Sodium/hydrogen exchanger family protein [Candidatus Izimaplasma bacterium HR1]